MIPSEISQILKFHGASLLGALGGVTASCPLFMPTGVPSKQKNKISPGLHSQVRSDIESEIQDKIAALEEQLRQAETLAEESAPQKIFDADDAAGGARAS